MSNDTQKPGEKPDKPGKKVEVNPNTGKPVTPPNEVISKPGAGHLPPTQKPGDEWKPGVSDRLIPRPLGEERS